MSCFMVEEALETEDSQWFLFGGGFSGAQATPCGQEQTKQARDVLRQAAASRSACRWRWTALVLVLAGRAGGLR